MKRQFVSVRETIDILFMYAIVMFILLCGTTMWTRIVGFPLYERNFDILLYMTCLLHILFSRKYRISNRKMGALVISIAYLAIYILATRYNYTSFIRQYIIPFFVLFLYVNYLITYGKLSRFLRVFTNVMLVLSLISLCFWLFGSLMRSMPGRKAISYYWTDRILKSNTYGYVYFENAIQNQGQRIVRNVGVFMEAPGHVSYLTYALLCEIGIAARSGKYNRIKIAVFSATMISTMSSKGVVILLLIVLMGYILRHAKSNIGMIIKVLFSIVLLIGGSIVVDNIVEAKLLTGSGSVRVDDVISALQAWKTRPIFGVGYYNIDEILQYSHVFRDNNGLSMGLTILMAMGGLYMLLFYIVAVYASSKSVFARRYNATWLIIITTLFVNLIISNGAFTIPYIFAVNTALLSEQRIHKRKAMTSPVRMNAGAQEGD